MRRTLIALLMLIFSVLVLPPGSSADPSPPLPSVSPVVYVAGDSIVATGYLAERDRYIRRLSDRVCGVNCGKPGYATLRSVACGGQRLTAGPVATSLDCTTPTTGTAPVSLTSLMPFILEATPRPTTLIISIGINDVGPATDSEKWLADYRKVVAMAEVAGVRVIPALMMAVNEHWPSYAVGANQRGWLNQALVRDYGADNVARFDYATKLPWNEKLDPWYEWNNGGGPGVPGDGLHASRLGVLSLADATPVHIIR